MKSNTARYLLCLVVAVGLTTTSGCVHTVLGPNTGIMSYPIPLSPYFQKREEDAFWNQVRYRRMPVLGPLAPGAPAVALDPPSEDEVMRKLEDARPAQGNIPWLHEVQRNNVRIIVEPIADYVDPPRVYPLVGAAQAHHARYKCIVNFTEITRVGWPVPYTTVREDDQEVIYIDHSHLHMVGNVDTGPGANF